MKIPTQELLTDLRKRTEDVKQQALALKQMPLEQLNQRPAEGAWSALECLEHLNRYGDFYLPEIRARMKRKQGTPNAHFRSGWLGNYFAKSMLPKEPLNTMKTFKSMDPMGSGLDESTLDKFVEQQEEMLQLLENMESVDLTRTRTSISISPWIKLRLGDTLRVVIYHNQRHLVQARRAVFQ